MALFAIVCAFIYLYQPQLPVASQAGVFFAWLFLMALIGVPATWLTTRRALQNPSSAEAGPMQGVVAGGVAAVTPAILAAMYYVTLDHQRDKAIMIASVMLLTHAAFAMAVSKASDRPGQP